MSKQLIRTIFGEKKNILAVGGHFISVPVKIDATVIVADVAGKKIVPLGSIVDKNGKVVNDGTAFGITYNEIDVTNGTEAVSVVIHGFVDGSQLPVAPSATALTALKQITIL
ncbi:hypothetical protein [Clostridium scatologenes]|uniref:Uncharacterized protein n=1 Tax=Clostridium scatologenes TaxID=1548 RepID=A0A0E3M8R2_CLOSL|nr:hypothetical protein [Clostridium scatologenes]AKA70140.1 hypothetical protein CSCA_3015 [Clostridium scatologenes]